MYGYQNVRSYLMAREHGNCQLCQKPFDKGNPSHIHHCKERGEEGSNRPKNLAILHKKCHEKLHKNNLKLSSPKPLKIQRIDSSKGPRLKMKVEWVDENNTKSTFLDNRNYIINLKEDKKPKFIITGNEMKPSFLDKNNRNK